MLTAAVRDLHRAHPGMCNTDVRTPSPDLWENNPYITALREDDPGVERLVCHYPLVHRSNQEPVHFLHGFTAYLSERLGVPITPTAFKGDIHLSAEEKAEEPLVHPVTGHGRRWGSTGIGGGIGRGGGQGGFLHRGEWMRLGALQVNRRQLDRALRGDAEPLKPRGG